MTAVEGERAAGPQIDDEAPAPPPEQVNPLPPEQATPEPGQAAPSPAGDESAQHDPVPSARGSALPEPREPPEARGLLHDHSLPVLGLHASAGSYARRSGG